MSFPRFDFVLYVALAERLDATLSTLHVRLARAIGPMCRIEIPE